MTLSPELRVRNASLLGGNGIRTAGPLWEFFATDMKADREFESASLSNETLRTGCEEVIANRIASGRAFRGIIPRFARPRQEIARRFFQMGRIKPNPRVP